MFAVSRCLCRMILWCTYYSPNKMGDGRNRRTGDRTGEVCAVLEFSLQNALAVHILQHQPSM